MGKRSLHIFNFVSVFLDGHALLVDIFFHDVRVFTLWEHLAHWLYSALERLSALRLKKRGPDRGMHFPYRGLVLLSVFFDLVFDLVLDVLHLEFLLYFRDGDSHGLRGFHKLYLGKLGENRLLRDREPADRYLSQGAWKLFYIDGLNLVVRYVQLFDARVRQVWEIS